jgi:hypothetical protein
MKATADITIHQAAVKRGLASNKSTLGMRPMTWKKTFPRWARIQSKLREMEQLENWSDSPGQMD